MKPLWTITITAALLAGYASAQSAHNGREIRTAVERAFPALQASGPVFVKKNGCVSCHQQTLPARATAMAKARGIRYDAALQKQQIDEILSQIGPARELLIEGSQVIPQIPATGSHILMALAAQGYAADANTAAIVQAVALQQRDDGSWPGWAPRFPISGGDIRETAVALRGLALYAPNGRRAEFNARIDRAQRWLVQARPATPDEAIVKLQGLAWAGSSTDELWRAANDVLALQRMDGGWAQLDTRDSDAYATGEALLALFDAGVLKPSDEAFQRGIRYLMETQEADGSWHVVTRAQAFQPLIDVGYPHGRDQWISSAGTSYATMALMLAVQ